MRQVTLTRGEIERRVISFWWPNRHRSENVRRLIRRAIDRARLA